MSKKERITYNVFAEDGITYMECKECLTYVPISSEDVKATRCDRCVLRKSIELDPDLAEQKSKYIHEPTGRPAGWHFMKEYVDPEGNVFYKGVEQPDLKGTLKPTKVKRKPKKKKKTLLEKVRAEEKRIHKLAQDYKNKQQQKKK